MDTVFTRITAVRLPENLQAGPDGFLPEGDLFIDADGSIPFPQCIVRDNHGSETLLLKNDAIREDSPGVYRVHIPANKLRAGTYHVQAEGCQTANLAEARPENWIKFFVDMTVQPAPAGTAAASSGQGANGPVVEVGRSAPAAGDSSGMRKLYFGIHKHMHQPYYRAADTSFWDGGNDEIFSTRAGAYRSFINMAAQQYQALPYAGLSMSWSGTLLEQLERASREGLAHGAFGGDWKADLAAAHLKTVGGHPRAAFSAFGFFHPLMPLIPARNIKAQILRHRDYVEREFGIPAARVLFPPETAFHVRMIPALVEAGIEAVIYDSIHRYRSCRDYPYAGREEGMLPPNAADQENPAVTDWLQLNNVWAGSKIAPSLLRPEYIKYTDVDGTVTTILGVPAERYVGNEDARGGFGALSTLTFLARFSPALNRPASTTRPTRRFSSSIRTATTTAAAPIRTTDRTPAPWSNG